MGQIDNLKNENFNKLNNDRFHETDTNKRRLRQEFLTLSQDGFIDMGALQNKLLELKNRRKVVL